MITESIIITLTIASVGLCSLFAKLLYSSKCRNVNLCFGCIECQRDTTNEQPIDLSSSRNLAK